MLPKVAFICTHNGFKSQVAEALGRHFANEVFTSYSAGTDIEDTIDPNALRLMKQLYGVDMQDSQAPKHVSALPSVDIVVTMGCGDACPFLPCRHMESWEMDSTSGKSDEELIAVIREIEEKVRDLKARVESEAVFSEEIFF